MPQVHKKICLGCVSEFESPGNGSCPRCGSDQWNFLNEQGGVRMPWIDALEGRPGPNGQVIISRPRSNARMRELRHRFPARVG